MNGFRPSNGLDYSLRSNRKDKANAISLSFLSREKGWKQVTVSYLATSRIDVFAGSFLADAYSLQGCGDDKNDLVGQIIPYGPKGNFNALAFISGLKTEDKEIKTSVKNSTYTDEYGKISVQLSSAKTLENIHISYVIWRKETTLIFKYSELSNTNAIGDYELIYSSEFKNGYQNY